MSLHALANHMAEKGRGPDTMLVHMAPSEVQGLQALAQAHGGSLTINPETGLPEAGFLDKLLPAILGAGISYISGGTIDPMTAAAMVGGVEAARTGDIGKGISAGLGAYGGAGLTAGVMGAGASSISAEQLAAGQLGSGQLAAEQAAGVTRGAFLPTAEATQGAFLPSSAATAYTANPSSADLLSKGFDTVTSSGDAAKKFAMANWKPMAAAALPVLADVGTTTEMPGMNQVPGKIRRYSYDPYGQGYTPTGVYEAPGTAANGGLMGMANGGMARYAQGDLIEDAASAGTAAPAFTDQQIQAAIEASRQQGFNNDQILQGAKANYGVDVSRFLNPVTTAPVVTAAPTGGLDTLAANQAATTLAQNTGGGGSGLLGGVSQVVQNAAAANPNLFSGNTAAVTGLDTLAANQAATGNTTATTALNNAGVTPVTTAAVAPAVDQQALAIQAAQAGVNAGKTPAQIAAEVDAQYGIKLNAQNVTDFIAANHIVPQANSDKYVANIAAAAAANPNATYDQIYAAMVANGLNPTDVAAAMEKAGLSKAAAYAATSKDFKGVAGGTGLAGLNANIKNAVTQAATAKPDATAAEINALLATYGADASDFKRAMGMTPEEWDRTHSSASTIVGGNGTDTVINTSVTGGGGNDTVTTSPVGVVTNTGAVLPVVTIPGTNVTRVVNPTQIATTAAETPTVLNEASRTTLPVGVGGNQTATINPNGTVSMTTGTPNMPVGGYTGMQSLRDAYTKGGGSLGYIPVAPKTMAEFNQKYNKLTGGSKQAYDYLMGGEYSPTPYTKTGEVMKPYAESVLGIPGDVSKKRYLFDPATRTYKSNPDYVPISYDSKGNKVVGLSNKDVASYIGSNSIPNKSAATSDYEKWMAENNVPPEQIASVLGISVAEAKKRFGTGKTAATTTDTTTTDTTVGNKKLAGGGLAAMAGGGMSGQYDLGSYSDGGRLLRGPGDGVSDSIPATIGKGRPARLADGEFVVPARIVSEIGNGSTEAGARKLYAMMDRVQAARRNSIGKGNVAKNSRADKYLPA